jgi:FkbM family methyltransferase
MRPRDVVKRAFGALGYEVSRASPHGGEAMAAQRALAGTDAEVVVDVGANAGRTAARYRDAFPGAIVHCFEPSPEPFATLEAWARTVDRVRANRLALADATGPAPFHRNRASETDSLLAGAPHADRYFDPALMATVEMDTVDAVTLDEYCEGERIARIDVLKIDVQGAERLVLGGARGLLSREAIAVVYTEAMVAPVYEGQGTLFDVGALMTSHGYHLYDLYDLRHGRNGTLVQVDALFVAGSIEAGLARRS